MRHLILAILIASFLIIGFLIIGCGEDGDDDDGDLFSFSVKDYCENSCYKWLVTCGELDESANPNYNVGQCTQDCIRNINKFATDPDSICELECFVENCYDARCDKDEIKPCSYECADYCSS